MTVDELLHFLAPFKIISADFDITEGNWYVQLPEAIQSNHDLVMTIITESFHTHWELDSQNRLFQVFEENFSNNENFMKAYLSKTYDGEFFVRSTHAIQMNYPLLKQYLYLDALILERGETLRDVSEHVLNNRLIMLRLICDMPYIFKFFPEHFQDDECFVTIAVSHDGLQLEYASKRLRSNEELVRTAVLNNLKAVLFAHKSLWELPDSAFYASYIEALNASGMT